MSLRKALLAATLALATAGNVLAFDILMVDDEDYSSHTPHITPAIEAAGYTYTLFDCEAEGRGPTFDEMMAYDLVIWYTANDGVGAYFWNGDDTDNYDIMAYLSAGGCMWYVGNDVLYDRYGPAPDTFAPGDFPFDFFGIASYDVQSRGDDGGSGVPQMDVVPGNPVTSETPLTWIYSGLWWADGVTPLQGVEPIYTMGPESYVLYGAISGILNNTTGFNLLSFFFDIYYMGGYDDNYQPRIDLIASVLDFFANQCGDVTDLTLPEGISLAQNYPNPFNPATHIDFAVSEPGLVTLTVYNVMGEVVATPVNGNLEAGNHSIEFRADNLSTGVYYYQLQAEGRTVTRKMVVMK